MDPVSYSPDTLDIWSNRPEMDYWLGILGEQVDNIVEKAIASEGNSPGILLCAQDSEPTCLLDAAPSRPMSGSQFMASQYRLSVRAKFGCQGYASSQTSPSAPLLGDVLF